MAQKVYDLDNLNYLQEIMSMLENDDDYESLNDGFQEGSDVASEDEVEECEGDSESEQEGDTDRRDDEDSDTTFLGKGKVTMWNKIPPLKRVRWKPHNLTIHLPSVKGNARAVKSVVECCNNIFTKDELK